MGLVFARLIGVDIEDLLTGARMVEEACQSETAEENPALFLASLKYAASRKYGMAAEIIMPYGDTLRSFGWWYAQLLGESLGKKYDTKGREVHYGRIPVAAVGTTDMHSSPRSTSRAPGISWSSLFPSRKAGAAFPSSAKRRAKKV